MVKCTWNVNDLNRKKKQFNHMLYIMLNVVYERIRFYLTEKASNDNRWIK